MYRFLDKKVKSKEKAFHFRNFFYNFEIEVQKGYGQQ